MAAYKTGAFVRSKYYTPFQKTPVKWIPRSKSGASKSRPRWAVHTCIGNVWELGVPPPPGAAGQEYTGHCSIDKLLNPTDYPRSNRVFC